MSLSKAACMRWKDSALPKSSPTSSGSSFCFSWICTTSSFPSSKYLRRATPGDRRHVCRMFYVVKFTNGRRYFRYCCNVCVFLITAVFFFYDIQTTQKNFLQYTVCQQQTLLLFILDFLITFSHKSFRNLKLMMN